MVVVGIMVLSSLVGCSDDLSLYNDAVSTSLGLTNYDTSYVLESLKKELLSYHTTDTEYGVVYHTSTAGGGSVEQYKIPDYIDLKKTPIDYNERIKNNSKISVEHKVSSVLLSDIEKKYYY
jgi:hypothetical protein